MVSCGQYVQRAANVSDQVGERTASGGCSDFHISHMASIILRILRSAHMSNASMREHWSFVVDHVSHSYNKITYPFLQFDCIIDCIIDYFCTEPLKPLVLHMPL